MNSDELLKRVKALEQRQVQDAKELAKRADAADGKLDSLLIALEHLIDCSASPTVTRAALNLKIGTIRIAGTVNPGRSEAFLSARDAIRRRLCRIDPAPPGIG